MNAFKKPAYCRFFPIEVTYSIKYWKHGNFGIPCCSKINLTEPEQREFFSGPNETKMLYVRKTTDNMGEVCYKVDLPNKSTKYFRTIDSIIDDPKQLNCQIVNDHKYINLDMDHYDQIITYKIFTIVSIGKIKL